MILAVRTYVHRLLSLAQMHGFPQRWWHDYEICMTRSTCIQCVKRRRGHQLKVGMVIGLNIFLFLIRNLCMSSVGHLLKQI